MRLWRVTTAVTAAVFLGALISWLPIITYVPLQGCMALGISIGARMVLFLVAGWSWLAATAGVGSLLAYQGKRLGPYLVLTPNLDLLFRVVRLVAPGQFTWAWTIIALSFLPIIAACLVAAQLLLDGVSRHLVGAFVGLLAAGLLLPTVDQGWLQDLSNASETPLSETTTATHTSC